MSDHVRSERLNDHVVRITLDRPPVNAIDRVTQRALTAALAGCRDDLDVRAVVLTGAGGSFCAGADLREEQSIERDEVGALLTDIGRTLLSVRSHRCPVIAAVDGAAHGGGLELALACDLRIATMAARFGAAGVNIGLVANFESLVEAIGAARARHLLLTGRACGADEALSWGLVTELLSDGDALQNRATELAMRIASRAPLAVEATKDCLNRVGDLSRADAARLQVEAFSRLFRTADHAEALHAFFAKRPARFDRR